MAKHKGIYRKVPTHPAKALLTLAALDLIAGAMINASDDNIRLLSVDGQWSVEGLAAGEGPIQFGVADGDYSEAEIEEAIEAAGSINLGDKVAQEQANRFVRSIGIISAAEPVYNEGKPTKTRLNWTIADGDQLQMWAYNTGAAPLTTGALLRFAGHLNINFVL